MKKNAFFFSFLLLLTVCFVIFSGCHKETNPPTALLNDPECKQFKSASDSDTVPDSLSCVVYSFDPATGRLLLNHMNAGFNCCPGFLYVQYTIENGVITVNEYEDEAQCDCDCLYDLEIEVTGVAEGKYQIVFSEPYAINLTPIEFQVDFTSSTTGTYCVVRNFYPWGLGSG